MDKMPAHFLEGAPAEIYDIFAPVADGENYEFFFEAVHVGDILRVRYASVTPDGEVVTPWTLTHQTTLKIRQDAKPRRKAWSDVPDEVRRSIERYVQD